MSPETFPYLTCTLIIIVKLTCCMGVKRFLFHFNLFNLAIRQFNCFSIKINFSDDNTYLECVSKASFVVLFPSILPLNLLATVRAHAWHMELHKTPKIIPFFHTTSNGTGTKIMQLDVLWLGSQSIHSRAVFIQADSWHTNICRHSRGAYQATQKIGNESVSNVTLLRVARKQKWCNFTYLDFVCSASVFVLFPSKQRRNIQTPVDTNSRHIELHKKFEWVGGSFYIYSVRSAKLVTSVGGHWTNTTNKWPYHA